MPALPFFARQQNTIPLGKISRFPIAPTYRLPITFLSTGAYAIGVSGSGKSKLLENIIYHLITSGEYGCGVLDPHSLLIDDLLRNLVTQNVTSIPNITERILYIDPSRTDYVIPLNVLGTPDTPYRIAASVIEAFRRTWPTLKEAPHFSNLMMHALLLLIACNKTLVDVNRLLIDKDWREQLLSQAGDPELTGYFHDRFDQWRDGAFLRESSLNKVSAISTNPHLKVMLGQKQPLDFAQTMDEDTILLLDLGRSDLETNKLIGSLIVTGLELGMRRRKKRKLWNLTIDEFAGYVSQESSEVTFAHVLSEGRKFAMTITASHQTLSQISPRILGALSNIRTKFLFKVGRYDAEYLAKVIGRVDTEAIKRDPLRETQHELFSPLSEQWEQWVDTLRFQKPRRVLVSAPNDHVVSLFTKSIPDYSATDEDIENMRLASLRRFGIPYTEAMKNLEADSPMLQSIEAMPEYDPA